MVVVAGVGVGVGAGVGAGVGVGLGVGAVYSREKRGITIVIGRKVIVAACAKAGIRATTNRANSVGMSFETMCMMYTEGYLLCLLTKGSIHCLKHPKFGN